MCVTLAECNEFGVGAVFNDTPLFQHDDLISVHNSAQTLGNDQGSATLHQILEGGVNLNFGAAVYAGSGIIQDKDTWISPQQTFPAGKN